jgi:hypothetical protein
MHHALGNYAAWTRSRTASELRIIVRRIRLRSWTSGGFPPDEATAVALEQLAARLDAEAAAARARKGKRNREG